MDADYRFFPSPHLPTQLSALAALLGLFVIPLLVNGHSYFAEHRLGTAALAAAGGLGLYFLLVNEVVWLLQRFVPLKRSVQQRP